MEMLKQRFALTASAALALAILSCLTCAVFAQSPPPAPNYNAGDAMKQAAPPATPSSETDHGKAAPPPVIIIEPEKQLTLLASEKLFILSITVAGATADEAEKLAPIVAPYTNRELTITEINEAAGKVTRFYRDRGYLVARAYVPRQNADDGVLTINIRRGSYGVVTVKNRSKLRKRVVQRTFERMKAGSPYVTRDSLERAMMLVTEMPGSSMPNVSLQPGKLPGTTDLNVKLDEAHRLHGYLLGDNQGSQYTGRKRLYGGLDVNSPFGLGDKLSLTAMTTEAEGLQNLRATYGFPLNYNGLRLAVSAAHTNYALGGVYKVLNGTGTVNMVEGTLSYPVQRRRDESFDLLVNWGYKKLRDDLNETSTHNPRNADVGTVTVQRTKQGTFLGRNIYTTQSASIELGQLEVTNQTERSLTQIDGTYSKLNVTLTEDMFLTKSLSAKTSLTMQKDLGNKVLDSSEQLFINGNGGVRAYAESVSGDNGYILNLESRYTLPKINRLQQAAALFFDNGGVNAQKNGTSLTNLVMADAGASYYATFHPAFVSVQLAQILGRRQSEPDKTRVWVQLGIVF